MKGAAGCNAECPGASSECCGAVMRPEGAAGAIGKAGGGAAVGNAGAGGAVGCGGSVQPDRRSPFVFRVMAEQGGRNAPGCDSDQISLAHAAFPD